jgi:hypothetical protein
MDKLEEFIANMTDQFDIANGQIGQREGTNCAGM